MIKKLSASLILPSIVFSALALSLIVWAAVSYRSDPSTTITVNEFGVCKKVTNAGSFSYFIPTNTGNEWSLFRTAVPGLSGLSLSSCVILNSATGLTCNQVCNNNGLSCASVGTDAGGTNAVYYIYYDACIPAFDAGTCATEMVPLPLAPLCYGHQPLWTNCLCQ